MIRPRFTRFRKGTLRVGDFSIRLIEVPHAPSYPNYGFVITTGQRKIVIFTDFHDTAGLLGHFVDADFIFLEANHDLLLRENPNPASRYHLNNQKTAGFLCDVVRQSRKTPAAVMLGHLSDERNRAHLALREVHSRDNRLENQSFRETPQQCGRPPPLSNVSR